MTNAIITTTTVSELQAHYGEDIVSEAVESTFFDAEDFTGEELQDLHTACKEIFIEWNISHPYEPSDEGWGETVYQWARSTKDFFPEEALKEMQNEIDGWAKKESEHGKN